MLRMKCVCVPVRVCLYVCACVLGVFAGGQEGREQSCGGTVGDRGYGWLMLKKLGEGDVRDQTRKLNENKRVEKS